MSERVSHLRATYKAGASNRTAARASQAHSDSQRRRSAALAGRRIRPLAPRDAQEAEQLDRTPQAAAAAVAHAIEVHKRPPAFSSALRQLRLLLRPDPSGDDAQAARESELTHSATEAGLVRILAYALRPSLCNADAAAAALQASWIVCDLALEVTPSQEATLSQGETLQGGNQSEPADHVVSTATVSQEATPPPESDTRTASWQGTADRSHLQGCAAAQSDCEPMAAADTEHANPRASAAAGRSDKPAAGRATGQYRGDGQTSEQSDTLNAVAAARAPAAAAAVAAVAEEARDVGVAERLMVLGPLLVAHLGGGTGTGLAMHCAWAIANLAAVSKVRRSTLMAQGALLPLLHMLAASGQPSAGAQDLEAGATAAWALCSLTKGRGNAALGTFVCMDGVQAAFVGALTQLHSWELTSEQPQSTDEEDDGSSLEDSSTNILTACWLLSLICAGKPAYSQRLLSTPLLLPLLHLLQICAAQLQPAGTSGTLGGTGASQMSLDSSEFSDAKPSSEEAEQVMLPALCCLANALAVLAPKSVALVATWNEGAAVYAVLSAASSGHSSLHKYAAWALSNVSTSEEGCAYLHRTQATIQINHLLSHGSLATRLQAFPAHFNLLRYASQHAQHAQHAALVAGTGFPGTNFSGTGFPGTSFAGTGFPGTGFSGNGFAGTDAGAHAATLQSAVDVVGAEPMPAAYAAALQSAEEVHALLLQLQDDARGPQWGLIQEIASCSGCADDAGRWQVVSKLQQAIADAACEQARQLAIELVLWTQHGVP